jgi:hypothetical protein
MRKDSSQYWLFLCWLLNRDNRSTTIHRWLWTMRSFIESSSRLKCVYSLIKVVIIVIIVSISRSETIRLIKVISSIKVTSRLPKSTSTLWHPRLLHLLIQINLLLLFYPHYQQILLFHLLFTTLFKQFLSLLLHPHQITISQLKLIFQLFHQSHRMLHILSILINKRLLVSSLLIILF